MTHNLTPLQLDILRRLMAGDDPACFRVKNINELVKTGYLVDVPTGLALTDAGRDAVAAATWYVIQQHHNGKHWVNIPNEHPFLDEQAAERRAAQYSVLNEALIRVVPEAGIADGQEPPFFTVFDFGKRCTFDTATGARIADPGFREVRDDFQDTGHFYQVQRRTPLTPTTGQIGTWEPASEQRFVDLDLAVNTARTADDEDQPFEYRVVPMDTPDVSPVVYYRGEPRPDLGLLDQLAQVGVGRLTVNQPLPVLKQLALGQIIGDWALHDPKVIVTICAEALAQHALSDHLLDLLETL